MAKEVSTMIVVDQDKILIQRRSKECPGAGFWNFPGGSVEKDESIEQASIRELKEESNLDVAESDIVYLGNFSNKYLLIHFFITDKFSDEVRLNKESDDYKWITLNELPEYKFVGGGTLHPKLLQNIKDFMGGKLG